MEEEIQKLIDKYGDVVIHRMFSTMLDDSYDDCEDDQCDDEGCRLRKATKNYLKYWDD